MPTIEELRLLGARVAGHADVLDIKTFSLSAVLDHEPAAGNRLSYEFEPITEFQRLDEGLLAINGFFRLAVSEERLAAGSGEDATSEPPRESAGQRESEEGSLAEIRFRMSALYTLRPFDDPGAQPFSDDELRAFTQSSGLFTLYPFARAAVSDLTTRVGLPALILPMLKIDLADELAVSRSELDSGSRQDDHGEHGAPDKSAEAT
jgi:hypothetical protein